MISLQGDFIVTVVEFYTVWLITELNSLQDIVECFNRAVYFLVDCLEYLDLTLATPSWIACYNTVALSLFSTPLKVLSKMIIPSVHQFSSHCLDWFF